MPDYKKGQIYAIRSHQTEDIYIGSTTQPLYKRLYTHKKNYKSFLNGKYPYVSSYEIIKYDDCYIELYELCPCNSKQELEKREGEIIRSIECVNKYVAGRTHKQHYEENKEKRLQQCKEYYDKNKEKILQQRKERRERNREEIKQYYKEYREKNKDKKREYMREWRKKKKAQN